MRPSASRNSNFARHATAFRCAHERVRHQGTRHDQQPSAGMSRSGYGTPGCHRVSAGSPDGCGILRVQRGKSEGKRNDALGKSANPRRCNAHLPTAAIHQVCCKADWGGEGKPLIYPVFPLGRQRLWGQGWPKDVRPCDRAQPDLSCSPSVASQAGS